MDEYPCFDGLASLLGFSNVAFGGFYLTPSDELITCCDGLASLLGFSNVYLLLTSPLQLDLGISTP